jgi:regulator of RNase E activity RraA
VGGTVIRPGDVVFADDDGIAVFDRSEALDIAAALRAKEAAEPELRTKITAGERLSDYSGAGKLFTAGLDPNALS